MAGDKKKQDREKNSGSLDEKIARFSARQAEFDAELVDLILGMDGKLDQILARRQRKRKQSSQHGVYTLHTSYGDFGIGHPYYDLVPHFERYVSDTKRTVEDIANEMNSMIPLAPVSSDYLKDLGERKKQAEKQLSEGKQPKAVAEPKAEKIITYLNRKYSAIDSAKQAAVKTENGKPDTPLQPSKPQEQPPVTHDYCRFDPDMIKALKDIAEEARDQARAARVQAEENGIKIDNERDIAEKRHGAVMDAFGKMDQTVRELGVDILGLDSAVENGFRAVNARLDGQAREIAGVRDDIRKLDDKLDRRFDAAERKITDYAEQNKKQYDALDTKVDQISRDVKGIADYLREFERRVNARFDEVGRAIQDADNENERRYGALDRKVEDGFNDIKKAVKDADDENERRYRALDRKVEDGFNDVKKAVKDADDENERRYNALDRKIDDRFDRVERAIEDSRKYSEGRFDALDAAVMAADAENHKRYKSLYEKIDDSRKAIEEKIDEADRANQKRYEQLDKTINSRYSEVKAAIEECEKHLKKAIEDHDAEEKKRYEALERQLKEAREGIESEIRKADDENRKRYEALDRAIKEADDRNKSRYEALDRAVKESDDRNKSRYEALDKSIKDADAENERRYKSLDSAVGDVKKAVLEVQDDVRKVGGAVNEIQEDMNSVLRGIDELGSAVNKADENSRGRYEDIRSQIKQLDEENEDRFSYTLDAVERAEEDGKKNYEALGKAVKDAADEDTKRDEEIKKAVDAGAKKLDDIEVLIKGLRASESQAASPAPVAPDAIIDAVEADEAPKLPANLENRLKAVEDKLGRKRIVSYHAADIEGQDYIAGSHGVPVPADVLKRIAGIQRCELSFDSRHVYAQHGTEYLVHANLAEQARSLMQNAALRAYFEQLSEKVHTPLNSADDIAPDSSLWNRVSETKSEKVYQLNNSDAKISIIDTGLSQTAAKYDIELIVKPKVDARYSRSPIDDEQYVHAARITVSE
jgi:hypothetical protein